jgi:hypothetical protein
VPFAGSFLEFGCLDALLDNLYASLRNRKLDCEVSTLGRRRDDPLAQFSVIPPPPPDRTAIALHAVQPQHPARRFSGPATDFVA